MLTSAQRYQQTLDLTIPEGQTTFFKVTGTHAIYLTGNYVVSPEDGPDDDDDMSPDEDELEGDLYDGESDELDNLEDPRITEVGSEEDEAPKLIKSKSKEKVAEKGKNKRVAEESDNEAATLDAIMDKSLKPAEPATNGEPKLSKKQLKKLKNNAGKAVEAAIEKKDVKKEDPSPAKGDKKVQFAKNLEQGPTGAAKEVKPENKSQPKQDTKAGKKENAHEKVKPTLGPKNLPDGVKIDDKKLGTGPACKKGDKVGMRYIGKLSSGKVFDGMSHSSTSLLGAPTYLHYSQQEGFPILLQNRRRRGHQRLGQRYPRHVSWGRATCHRTRKACLWQQIYGRYSAKCRADLRRQAPLDFVRRRRTQVLWSLSSS